MALERADFSGAQNVTALPAIRPAAAVRRARIDEMTSSSATGSGVFLLDESIDIQLGFDRQTGHLAIVAGDVRIEARLPSQPAPGSLGSADAATGSIGSLVNLIA